eukprot:3316719-Pyramimonas_sp.AAC.1
MPAEPAAAPSAAVPVPDCIEVADSPDSASRKQAEGAQDTSEEEQQIKAAMAASEAAERQRKHADDEDEQTVAAVMAQSLAEAEKAG